MNKSNVEKLRKNNYKEIYEKRVLPKKGVISHTLETHEATLKVFEDFSSYRERANQKVLGGETFE